MARGKKYKPEQVVNLLRQTEVAIANGKTTAQACNTNNYIEDLSDLAIDVTGNGYPDIVSCSYWSKPLTWWENPGKRGGAWREHLN